MRTAMVAMQVQGITPGARVALLINNAVASMPFDFACAKAGVNRVPMNARLSLDEHDPWSVKPSAGSSSATWLLHYPIQGGS